jgi:hypothetical protein
VLQPVTQPTCQDFRLTLSFALTLTFTQPLTQPSVSCFTLCMCTCYVGSLRCCLSNSCVSCMAAWQSLTLHIYVSCYCS